MYIHLAMHSINLAHTLSKLYFTFQLISRLEKCHQHKKIHQVKTKSWFQEHLRHLWPISGWTNLLKFISFIINDSNDIPENFKNYFHKDAKEARCKQMYSLADFMSRIIKLVIRNLMNRSRRRIKTEIG